MQKQPVHPFARLCIVSTYSSFAIKTEDTIRYPLFFSVSKKYRNKNVIARSRPKGGDVAIRIP